VTRDAMMVELHDRFPQYDFATHKGYCTPEHQAAMQRHGPCPEHRQVWDNVIAAARVFAAGRTDEDTAEEESA